MSNAQKAFVNENELQWCRTIHQCHSRSPRLSSGGVVTGWEDLARRLVSDFQYNTRTMTHLPEYKTLWKRLRDLPEFRRIASATYPEGRPDPSFVFQVQHSVLGRLTLRTATTVFTGISSYSMVSYVPGDKLTLEVYRRNRWQPK